MRSRLWGDGRGCNIIDNNGLEWIYRRELLEGRGDSVRSGLSNEMISIRRSDGLDTGTVCYRWLMVVVWMEMVGGGEEVRRFTMVRVCGLVVVLGGGFLLSA